MNMQYGAPIYFLNPLFTDIPRKGEVSLIWCLILFHLLSAGFFCAWLFLFIVSLFSPEIKSLK